VLFAVLVLVGCLVASFGLLACWSHSGRPRSFLGPDDRASPSSLSEKLRVPINGVEQGMFIEGRDVGRPILLFLHGGMPGYFLSRRHPTGLEALFNVCWWEQRGAGLSFQPGAPPPTVEQLLEDTREVARYLCQRFGQTRVYLMAHSGGTFLGMQAIARWPELFHAYVGVAQIANQLDSEQRAWAFMIEEFRRRGNTRMVRKLSAARVSSDGGVPRNYLALRDPAMHELGVGTTRTMTSVVRGIFVESLRCREYTLREKVGMWRAKAASGVSTIWRDMLAADLAEHVPSVVIPVYFFHGKHDHTCAYPLARAYFEKLEAPIKGFYTFDESAHSPIFEEPAKSCRILREDVLAGANRLSDEAGRGSGPDRLRAGADRTPGSSDTTRRR
jgi:pimeloyl-ACP methyl ester carboxylesterase